MKKPTPISSESPFNYNEMFFSVTDKRGVIRFGNDVFVRVSIYPKETLLGAPHSIVRHPDMPRAVFKVFWDILKQNKPVGAYVKNMAGNGSYYWVFAFAFPLEDGYLSIRFKPSSPIFTKIQELYSEVLEFEKQNDDLEASYRFLLGKIQEAGFPNYEHFMVRAAMEELASRALQCKRDVTKEKDSQNISNIKNQEGLSQISQVTATSTASLNNLFQRVGEFQESNQIFSNTINTLEQGFQSLKFISLNMQIAAAKFGDKAVSLGVVSNEFSSLSGTIETHLSGLSKFIQTLSSAIQQCMLRIAGLNSQMLMVDFFVKESIAKLQTSDNAFAEMVENQSAFSKLFRQYNENLQKEVSSLKSNVSQIDSEMEEVSKFVTGLEVIRQIGAVESARSDEIKSTFSHYLSAMDDFIQLLRESTIKIHHEVASLNFNAESIINSARNISGSVDSIFNLASKFDNGSTTESNTLTELRPLAVPVMDSIDKTESHNAPEGKIGPAKMA